MPESTSKSHKVGDLIDVKEGAVVVRPDGSRLTMGGTAYVLDVAGAHEVDGTEVKVK